MPPRVQTFDLTALPDQLRGPVEQALVKPLKLFMDETSRTLGRAWVLRDNLALFEDIRIDVPDEWIAPTLLNSWTDGTTFGDPTPAYRWREDGDLELRGFLLAPGGGATVDTAMFQMQYQPIGRATFVQWNITAALAHGRSWVTVDPDGSVIWRDGDVGASQQLALSGIRVPALDPQPPLPGGSYAFPVELPWTLERMPLGLFLLEAREREPSGTSNVRIPVGGVDWELIDRRGERHLRVRRVTGLLPGRSYILRLVALGG